MYRVWWVWALIGCGPGLEVVGFDEVLQTTGWWVRTLDGDPSVPVFHSFWWGSDPAFDCAAASERIFPTRAGTVDQARLQELFAAVEEATTDGEECRALLTYHAALLELSSPHGTSLELGVFFTESGDFTMGATVPELGVTLGRRSSEFRLGDRWGGAWDWNLRTRSAQMVGGLDCAAADAGQPWMPDLPDDRSGGMLGSITVERAGEGYRADVNVALDHLELGIQGTVEGRVRFLPCDHGLP